MPLLAYYRVQTLIADWKKGFTTGTIEHDKVDDLYADILDLFPWKFWRN